MSSSGQGSGSQMASQPQGPPYAPTTWSLGGKPNVNVDIPVTAVFLALFILSAVAHMTILQINLRRGHKFIMSGLLFGFSMARIVACCLKISSTALPENVNLGIAAEIFVAAGVVILYVVNIIFTQRVIRALHPKVGWHIAFESAVKILIAMVIISIIMVITAVIQSFETLNKNIQHNDRIVVLFASTYFSFIAILPVPVIIIAYLWPHDTHVDKFGSGKWRTKIAILLFSATIVGFGANYRTGVSYLPPRPFTEPIYPAMHKGAFYGVNFTIEIIVLYLYAIARVDKRFHIPNGARDGYRSQDWKRNGPQHGDEEAATMTSVAGSEPFYKTHRYSSSAATDSKTMSKPGTPYTNKSRFSNDGVQRQPLPEWPLRQSSDQSSRRAVSAEDATASQQQQQFQSEYGVLPRTPQTEARIAALRQAHVAADGSSQQI